MYIKLYALHILTVQGIISSKREGERERDGTRQSPAEEIYLSLFS